MYEYCNMIKLKHLTFRESDDYLHNSELMNDYSHIWVDIKTHLDGHSTL